MFRYDIYYSRGGSFQIIELTLEREIRNEDDVKEVRQLVADQIRLPMHFIYIQYWHLKKRIKKVKQRV
jgi:hypothetical protein